MKIATSNIALTALNHGDELASLPALGIEAVEIAPSRVWHDTWKGLGGAEVTAYRNQIEGAGLSVVGLHSLFFDHPELGLFKDQDTRAQTMEYMVHLSALCRDLGGRTLIYGGGRMRGDIPAAEARAKAISFMGELCQRIEDHGTIYCFEPLGPAGTDFINSALEALDIVEAVNHPAFAVQLDAKALFENDEMDFRVFEAVESRLVHFHANEPGLGVIGTSGKVDHAALGQYLRRTGYQGYVSIEQRQIDPDDALGPLGDSARAVKEFYHD